MALTKVCTYGLMAATMFACSRVRAEEFTADIVIYGSSPAALSAAVQAKRMGKTVLIVAPEKRMGGLTTGGLGQTDIGNKAAFGGIALEFYRDVAKWYADEKHWTRQKSSDYFPDGQCAGSKDGGSMWTFEPSAACAILEGWEKRDQLDIHRGEYLDRGKDGVSTAAVGSSRRIVAFRTLAGNTYCGKMFIDATYEGDLMAAAGVSYTVGREGNAVYGETINGVERRYSCEHQFLPRVDAYVKKGDPQSGLLPGLEPDTNEPDGAGDRRVQAYCFRMCLTDDPANRIPFAKPASYRELDYELLLRNFEAGTLDRNGLPWINSAMPNRKTDTNNRTGFSTDFIGQNWNYPEASYAEREQIARAHLAYQQGLMWTLANHPRVPEKVRREVSKWGTCRDEFADGFGNGWQRQLYVREARRLVGDYIMTEHNCRGEVTAARAIALGAYGMDSHNCRRYADKDGFAHNEGDVQDYNSFTPGAAGGFYRTHRRTAKYKRFEPYPIDYGAIIPKRGECANLFVPVCLSASHIAFGSIRMEPVFFALGQVAGTAAAQAIDAMCAVQDLNYGPLRAQLLKDGQVLELTRKPVLKTPETSRLFVAHTDEVSRVVSYILKPGLLNFHHQSIYFTARSMTDDGRFVMFTISPNEFRGRREVRRQLALIDFKKDVAFALENTDNWYIPWLDVERDQIWKVDRTGVHRRDLLVDPQKDILVCPVPEPLTYVAGSRRGYGTHITLSPDRRRIFMDASTDGLRREGVINLDTGKWEEWAQAAFCCNHGQFNPTDPTLAMCAFEYGWKLMKNELPPEQRARAPMLAKPYITKVIRPDDYLYPRLWLFRPNGEHWMVPARIANRASHEIFDWDGSGFYWCNGGKGVSYHDLATERQTLIMPCRATHATMTANKKYLVADDYWADIGRGGGWCVAFWNREEHRGAWVFNRNPPMIRNRSAESKLHPDPHPQFVCKDRYIISTAIRSAGTDNPNDNYMALAITPVKQLIAKTSAALTPVKPHHFVLDWRPDPTLKGLPHEITVDTRLVRAKIPTLARPAIAPLEEAYTAYSVEAKVNGEWQRVTFEPLQHPYDFRQGALLRFVPPEKAEALRFTADAPGRFEVRDAELCDNLFNRRNLHDLYPPKAIATFAPGEKPVAAAECDVSSVAGKPVQFMLDFKNFAFCSWQGEARLEQFNAADKSLGLVTLSRFNKLTLAANRRARLRDTGHIHPQATKVRLFFEGTPESGTQQLEVQQLNLRVAVKVPNVFEGTPTR